MKNKLINPFKKSNSNKRYYTQTYYLNQRFGCKIFKVSLSAGTTCPNIDGTKGYGGCIYCSEKGSGDFGGDSRLSLGEQFEIGKEKMHRKWKEAKYIAYFQSNTNTYLSLETLAKNIETVLKFPNVVGVTLSTRPDCLPDDILDYLQELANKTYLVVELGLQTIDDTTAKNINRCHTYDEFLIGYHALFSRNIPICVHIINGLPGETKHQMLETAKAVAQLKPHSVKIHLLYIIEKTVLAKQFLEGKFCEMSLEDYVDIVCDQIEIFHEDTIIERLTGDGDPQTLIAPLWSLKKFVVMNEIDKEMLRRDSMQAKYYKST